MSEMGPKNGQMANDPCNPDLIAMFCKLVVVAPGVQVLWGVNLPHG